MILDSFKRTGIATFLYPTLATRFAFVKNYRKRELLEKVSFCLKTILGDPGADGGGEGKCKRAGDGGETGGFFFSTAKGVDLAMNIIGSRVESVFGSIRYRLHCKYESLNSMATLT